MGYYNRDGERVKNPKKGMKYLNSGQCAKVFYDGNSIFKEYYFETRFSCRLSPEIFEELKDIHNVHFVELFDIYTHLTFIDLFLYQNRKISFVTDAYTAKFYENSGINILYQPISYVLDNFRELEQLFDIFSSLSIEVNDVKRDNLVMDTNKIVLIDPDCFVRANSSQETIAIGNKRSLFYLFQSMYLLETLHQFHNQEITSQISSYLTNIQVTEHTDITHEISKQLKLVKKSIDRI